MEPNGEFLLQLLQGGGGGGNGRSNSGSGGGGRRGNGASSSEDVEGSSAWQHRDPAVAALGPSHSYHAGEPLLQQQPNQLFMAPPPYGGGVWTPSPHQHHQQQQHHHHHHQLQHQQQQQQFFGFGGTRLPPYPPPPSAQLTEPWRSDAAPGWLPPPRASDGVARPWSQGSSSSMPKAPLPLPPQQQQFLGDGAELLQLLLGGNSQNLKPLNPPLGPGELLGDGRTVPVDHGLPRAQVHGPIGPPKRSDQLEPPPLPLAAGGEDLLGRFWALPNGSPEPLNKPIVSLPEEHMRALSLTGGLDASKTIPSKSKGSKPPGFFGARDGMPVETTFGASTALNQFSGLAKGPLAWDSFQDGTATGLKQESHAVRPSDDRGNYLMPPNASRFVGAARNREDGLSKASGQARDPTSLPSTDANESSASRELGRGGARGSGRRGGLAGRAEMGRRSSTGQWVAVNEKPRDRDSEREGCTSNLHGPDGSASADGDASGSSFASPPSAKATAASSGKDESPNGSSSGGKSKEDMKRRRGQIQEWRMKQASPPHSKPSAEPGSQGAGELSQQDGNAEGVLPLASQVDRPGLPSNTVRHSMPGSATDESKQQLQYQLDEGVRSGGRERAGRYLFENGRLTWEDGLGGEEEEDLMRELNISGYAKLVEDAQHFSTTPLVTQSAAHLTVLTREETELEEKPGNVRESRDVRRHQQRMNVPTNLFKGDVQRLDFETFNPQLLAIYKSLIPSQEEVQRQEKFLTQLDRLVSREWGCAKLFLFGSCANDFGVRNSDIDICLSVDDEHSSKAELVTKMAAILRSDDMQNVQALTHARVPIVKFTDPDTGINCDICVNNMLAVVNSKLLHDYSQVDPRLRQLAFLVKHWAKQRQVNETYRGTLSSYAYVLMCIHFLQQRRPAILPCLQSMQPTYEVTVGTIKCSYFDKVNTLNNFGARNKESVAELLTYFFEYWASCHDYNRWVISVRTGGYLSYFVVVQLRESWFLDHVDKWHHAYAERACFDALVFTDHNAHGSKDEKDWTRRIGNERHLICIEDPFEVTHDLGRVVDRHSIRVLRDEFKLAAKILRQDPNPGTNLFEPFIREKV